jgi:hypothetical protein
MPGLPACAAPPARRVVRRSIAVPQLARGGAARRRVRAAWLHAASGDAEWTGFACAPATSPVSSRVRAACCAAAPRRACSAGVWRFAATQARTRVPRRQQVAAHTDAGNRQSRQPLQAWTCSAPRSRGRRAWRCTRGTQPRKLRVQARRAGARKLCASRWAHARAAELAHASESRVPFRVRADMPADAAPCTQRRALLTPHTHTPARPRALIPSLVSSAHTAGIRLFSLTPFAPLQPPLSHGHAPLRIQLNVRQHDIQLILQHINGV